MLQKFTQQATQSVFHATHEAKIQNTIKVEPHHILLGLINDSNSNAANTLNKLGQSQESVQKAIREQNKRNLIRFPAKLVLSTKSKAIIDIAYEEARSAQCESVGTEHILLGVLIFESKTSVLLSNLGITVEEVRETAKSYTNKQNEADNTE